MLRTHYVYEKVCFRRALNCGLPSVSHSVSSIFTFYCESGFTSLSQIVDLTANISNYFPSNLNVRIWTKMPISTIFSIPSLIYLRILYIIIMRNHIVIIRKKNIFPRPRHVSRKGETNSSAGVTGPTEEKERCSSLESAPSPFVYYYMSLKYKILNTSTRY